MHYNDYLHTLIVFSGYAIKDIFSKIYKDIPMKEIMSQMLKEPTSKTYLKFFQLLIDSGIDLDSQNKQGETALITSIILNNIIMAEALIENNVDLEITTKKGYKAIEYAQMNPEIKTLLLKHGAKQSKRSSDKKFLKKIGLEIKKRVKQETDIDEEDLLNDDEFFNYGTKLSKSIESKKVKDLKIAISKGSDLSIIESVDLVKDGYGHKFIDLAIKNGVDVDRQDKKGKTALMHACQHGKKKIVEVLVKNRANIDIRDLEGNDVWHYATISDNEKIIDILRNYDEISAFIHNPQDLVQVLSNFTRDTPIKYTTHTWDFGSLKKEHGDFQGFIKAIKIKWEEFEDDLKELSPDLHHKIHNFLLNKDETTNGWFGKEKISIGWSSLEGLEEWCNKGNDPFEFKLKRSFVIDGKDIARFGDIISMFKREIEIRKEYHMLENIFGDLEESFNEKYTFETSKLNGKNFYTDVEIFKQVLKKILHEIKERDFFEVLVEATNATGKYIDLKIVQIGSNAQLDSAEILKEAEDGGFADIKKSLTNLCDWSIESEYGGVGYRVNYLRSDKNIKEIERLDGKPKGFTHILRFYI